MINRIEVCGLIASGKSSIVAACKSLKSNIVFEDFSKVSFLDDFYKNQDAYAFETELAFTLQHFYQLKKHSVPKTVAVCDFSLVGDYAFARTTLKDNEQVIYDALFNHILERAGKPQKVIYMNASVDALLMRIRNRKRLNEQGISPEYLLTVKKYLEEGLREIYHDVPIVEINSEQVSLSDYNLGFLTSLFEE